MLYINLLALLIIGHYAADYMQTGFTATMKAPRACVGWQHIALGHASIQAIAMIAVFSYLGFSQQTAILFGAVELVLHFLIDIVKSRGDIRFHTDQSLHIACKAAYVLSLQIQQFSWVRIGIIASMVIVAVIAAVVLVVVVNGNREVTK